MRNGLNGFHLCLPVGLCHSGLPVMPHWLCCSRESLQSNWYFSKWKSGPCQAPNSIWKSCKQWGVLSQSLGDPVTQEVLRAKSTSLLATPLVCFFFPCTCLAPCGRGSAVLCFIIMPWTCFWEHKYTGRIPLPFFPPYVVHLWKTGIPGSVK